jgi:hypothetical protein
VTAPPPPPGWYSDTIVPGQLRWWDGTRWTESIQAAPRPAAAGRSTDGFAIASLVLGILGGTLLAIVFGFVALSRIKRSAGRKAGRGLAIAGISLGFFWIALVALVVILAVAGVFDDSNAKRFSGEKKAVAQTVDDFESAADDHDGARLCRLFTARFRTNIAAGAGKPCPEAILEGNQGKRQAHLDVKTIALTGDRAIARVEEGGDPEVWAFQRQGPWKVDNITRATG